MKLNRRRLFRLLAGAAVTSVAPVPAPSISITADAANAIKEADAALVGPEIIYGIDPARIYGCRIYGWEGETLTVLRSLDMTGLSPGDECYIRGRKGVVLKVVEFAGPSASITVLYPYQQPANGLNHFTSLPFSGH